MNKLIDKFNVNLKSKNFIRTLNKNNYLKFSGIFNNNNRVGINKCK